MPETCHTEEVLTLEQFQSVLERSPDPVFVKSNAGKYIFCNAAFADAAEETDIVGRYDYEVFPQSMVDDWIGEDAEVFAGNTVVREDRTRDGRVFLTKLVPVQLESGPGLLGTRIDVTEHRLDQLETIEAITRLKRQAEMRAFELEDARDRIEYVSLHDPHTGIANRRYLEQVLADHREAGTELAVLHVDLDRFKQVNDTLGHAAGDHVLRAFTTRLTSVTRLGDFVARVGGDEFLVICEDGRDLEPLITLGERIVKVARDPIPYQDTQCRIGASIGVARSRDTDGDYDRMLSNADIALYSAKARGRNRVDWFSPEMREETSSAAQLGEDLERALEQNQFVPHYQLQFCARTLRPIGVEAGARWLHPSRGLLGPRDFLSAASRIGILEFIEEGIFERATAEIDVLRAAAEAPLRLSLNVTAKRLMHSSLMETVRALSIGPGELSFELQEAVLFESVDAAGQVVLDGLRELGIGIEVDDFGTGDASILTLMRLSPDRVKIDETFIAGVASDAGARDLVTAMIGVARSLDIAVTAEGVETIAQQDVLRDLGCDVLQGFLYGGYMDVRELAAFLRTRHDRRRA
ncbi:MAG: EAL domain-containing protein [Pseudomonadota bacterium]